MLLTTSQLAAKHDAKSATELAVKERDAAKVDATANKRLAEKLQALCRELDAQIGVAKVAL